MELTLGEESCKQKWEEQLNFGFLSGDEFYVVFWGFFSRIGKADDRLIEE